MDPDAEAVPYDEFLALARDEGLIALDVQVVQAPGEANGHTAVVQVTARTAQGSFGAVGEASPRTAPEPWHPFLTTLAELRAKARALRDLTGLDHTVTEELSTPYRETSGAGDDLTAPAPAWRQPPVNGVAPRSAPAPAAAPTRPTLAQAPAAPRSPVRPAPPGMREDDADKSDDPDGPEGPDEPAPPTMASDDDDDAAPGVRPVAAQPPARAFVAPDDEPDEGFEAIGKDMEAKLLKMAMSIADLEGSEISETEARQKLDDFFNRAFKHPLNRATRMEGQRVVQRLSGDLARLRTNASEEKD